MQKNPACSIIINTCIKTTYMSTGITAKPDIIRPREVCLYTEIRSTTHKKVTCDVIVIIQGIVKLTHACMVLCSAIVNNHSVSQLLIAPL